MASITFQTKKSEINIKVSKEQGEWLSNLPSLIYIENHKKYTIQDIQNDYEKNGLEDFELFWDNKPVNQLYKVGLIML